MHNSRNFIRRSFEKMIIPLVFISLVFTTFLGIFIPNATGVAKPDLMIDEFNIISPIGTIFKNDLVEFRIKVRNVGTASLSTDITLALCIDGAMVNSTIISSLGVGSSIIKTLGWKATMVGEHIATAYVDYYDDLYGEPNEGNNIQSISVTIAERPTDIVVGEIKTHPPADNIWVNESVFVNTTINNIGKDVTQDVRVQFYVNDSKKGEKTINAIFLEEGESYNVSFDWMPTKPGPYTLKIEAPKVSGETNTDNNIAKRNVYVKSRGVSLNVVNVTTDIPYDSGKKNETATSAGGTAVYAIEIKNIGTENDTFNVTAKKISGKAGWNINLSKNSFTLSPDEVKLFNVSVTSPADAQNNEKAVFEIKAESTSNSKKNATVILTTTVLADLYIEYVTVDYYLSIVNKTTIISAEVGSLSAPTKNILVEILVDDKVVGSRSIDIGKNGNKTISIDWKVDGSVGFHEIGVRVDYNNTIPEYNESNNFKKIDIIVMKEPEWWHHGWHYRRAYAIPGSITGNVSVRGINFTVWLKELNIINKKFDENSIRVVKYYSNGTVEKEVTFNFTRDLNFNATTNALGNISWKVEGSGIKYYCIYFDVEENNWTTKSSKSSSCPPSPKTFTIYTSTLEGWWSNVIEPEHNGYYSPNTNVSVAVETVASVDNVTVEFYKKGINTPKDIKYLTSTDNRIWTLPGNYSFSEEGNWTIKVISRDRAGYETITQDYFHIGKPDLIVEDMTNLPSKLYELTEVKSMVTIKCADSGVSDVVKVMFKVIEENITQYKTISSMDKDESVVINFTWTPMKYGWHNITVKIDPENNIKDSNRKNNQETFTVYVYGLPDINITSIYVESPVDEGEQLNVTVYLKNEGHADAENCMIILYANQGTLHYSEVEKQFNDTIEDIIPNDGQDYYIELVLWENATYGDPSYNGKWIIGVKIIPDIRDLVPGNNYGSTTLFVNKSEERKPDINGIIVNNIVVYPEKKEDVIVELGDTVTIIVNATDESGIWNVTLNLTYPDNSYELISLQRSYENTDLWTHEFQTIEEGTYSFYVIVVDASYNKNERISAPAVTFLVTGDVTPPTIKDFYAEGFDKNIKLQGRQIQILLQNKQLIIKAQVIDEVEIAQVKANITYPNGYIRYIELSYDANNWYSNITGNLSMPGMYAFNIYAIDTSGNPVVSPPKIFWVTYSLNDTDSDGMPDQWEIDYNLDPLDPTDASSDPDNDGYTNIEEYLNGTNPRDKSYLFLIWDKIMENWKYSIMIIALLIVLIALSLYGIWRSRKR
jgi:subtilase family serine protease